MPIVLYLLLPLAVIAATMTIIVIVSYYRAWVASRRGMVLLPAHVTSIALSHLIYIGLTLATALDVDERLGGWYTAGAVLAGVLTIVALGIVGRVVWRRREHARSNP